MDTAALRRNPLLPILIGFLVAAFFNVRFYFVEHQYPALGAAIVVPIAVFVGLFFMRSRLAWTAAVSVACILVAVMLLTYHFGYMGFPLTLPIAIVDLALFIVFIVYMWRTRESYFRYVAAKEI